MLIKTFVNVDPEVILQETELEALLPSSTNTFFFFFERMYICISITEREPDLTNLKIRDRSSDKRSS